jgi:hypothetical protein
MSRREPTAMSRRESEALDRKAPKEPEDRNPPAAPPPAVRFSDWAAI